MSMRRARIKAVVSLPPRRKNAESSQPKDTIADCQKPKLAVFRSPQVRTYSKLRNKITSPLAASPSNKFCEGPDSSQTENIIKHIQISNIDTINENNELQITDSIVNKLTHNVATPVINKSSKAKITESDTEENIAEAVIDGIVPLKLANNVSKSIDLLKNEIISENAEVLFDPIVPLPSPSKVRAKLRPAPKLGLHRRSSFQGSASESEDESRRAQISSGAATPSVGRQRHDSQTSTGTRPSLINSDVGRVRNDSISSSLSTIPPVSNVSPSKEKTYRHRRHEASSRRMAAMRLKHENFKRDKLTMYDLIYYNPTSNPIIQDKDELKAKEEDEKDAEMAKESKHDKNNDSNNKPQEDIDDHEADAAPVPQIKLDSNGKIIIDEKSLVIKQTDNGRKVSASVVREGAWSGGGGKYIRAQRTAQWSATETVRFYRALAAVGTDFTLMTQLFPDRSRRDLKIKFKKEEKRNCAQVDKALRYATSWDLLQLKKDFERERVETERQVQKEGERFARQKRAAHERVLEARERHTRRSSLAAKAIDSPILPRGTIIREDTINTADDILKLALEVTSTSGTKTPCSQTPALSSSSKRIINKNSNIPKASPSVAQKNMTPNSNTSNSPGVSNNCTTANPSPSNFGSGSLVVLTVNDPMSPSKKRLQTYISQGGGRLTHVTLPTNVLNSVVGYMKKGTPKRGMSAGSSPHFTSPSSATNQESRNSSGSHSANEDNPSPMKRIRHTSLQTQI